MKDLMKESFGDLNKLKILGESKTNSFTTEQLIDENLKNVGGESRKEVSERMEKSFYRVFNENIGKNIAIVSHGASIKFFLMKWCRLNSKNQLEYEKNVISVSSPGVILLKFNNENLISLKQIL